MTHYKINPFTEELDYHDDTASSIVNTPSGNISSTTVQAAINELDTEKVAKAGDTMTGDLRTTDSVKTRSSTLTRNASGFVTSKVMTGGSTYTYTRDANNFITSKTDTINTWTYTRNASNQITSTTVT